MEAPIALIPKVSIGPYRLGMSRHEIESLLGRPPSSFRRTETSTNEILAYDDQCFFFEIDATGEVLEISAFRPNEVTLDQISLLDRPLSDVCGDLVESGRDMEPNDVGAFCSAAGINLVEVEGVVDCVELRD